MPKKTPQQPVINLDFSEKSYLNNAVAEINKAMDLIESSQVRKFEYLIKDFDSRKLLHLMQAIGNTWHLKCEGTILIEAHKSVWKMEYNNENKPP